ncbi:hypothetical protein CA260_17885 [Dyella jiangningensis]|uniref:Autotransporter domain-containing protein n=2 Tax=Dyella jiangningensis TaxID=1379159 RepID=A0A328P106_9GAMM|nr:hypothetical protein CA260_17885 [Dyella jiangningensis]
MEAWRGADAPGRTIVRVLVRPCAMAVAVAMALGLSGCGGGGGGGNVKPTQPTSPPVGPTGFTGGNIDVGANTVTVWPDNLSGSINLIKGGAGTLTLTGTNTYSGGTTINQGVLQIGNGSWAGSITGDVVDNALLVFNRSDDITFNGIVSGSGALVQAGNGALILTGANTYAGGTTISGGLLRIGGGGTTGSIIGDVLNNGTLSFDRADDVSFAHVITGTGGFIQAGTGTLFLTGTNSYTGTTQIDAGALYVNGNQSAATGATTVANGATLGGYGTLGGDVFVADGAALAPGDKGATGTLTINGNLTLSSGSLLNFGFGQATGGTQAGDLVNVKGNLTLDGVLNIDVASGGDLGPGVHRLFNYDGSLVDNGLTLGIMPSTGWAVQTGVAHEVNLVDTKGMVFSFWDGDAGPKGNNVINGGNGTWATGGTNNNWTGADGAINAPFSDSSFAVFQGAPGTVTVNDGNGIVHAQGMQFASDGYVIQGDAINLVGSVDDTTQSILRVGDGTSAGAGFKATINSALDGGTALVKTDAGTLVLGGNNTYTGGTIISGGVLQIGNGGATGSILGNVTDNASLAFNRSDNLAFSGIVSGSGAMAQLGTGKLTLTGANTYAGGTMVNAGTLEVAAGAALGAGDITVGVSNVSYGPTSTLQVDQGASLSNHIALQGRGGLDNAGVLGGNTSVAVDAGSAYFDTPAVQNHDGGIIQGNHAGIALYGYVATVQNSSGGLIEGGDIGIDSGYGGSIANDGPGSNIRSVGGIAIRALLAAGTVQNTGGGAIAGGAGAIDLQYGGSITNDGVGSSIRSANGFAIRVSGDSAVVKNTGGATISGATTALYLQQGGSVTNAAGSTIETTGTMAGDCAGAGDCAIFVAPDSQTAGGMGRALTLTNAGTIVGNVQMNPTAVNFVTLSPGGSIHGDLDIGSNNTSLLTLNGSPGTVQLYSQAVTGKTTFAGFMSGPTSGTWIIDNDDLNPRSITISGGTLQIGNGGTTGSIGQGTLISLYHGSLVFDRSDDVTFSGTITSYNSQAYDGTLVQAGAGTLTLPLSGANISPSHIVIQSGTLQIDNTGNVPGSPVGSTFFGSDILNNGSLVFDSSLAIFGGTITGTGSVTQNGSSALILAGLNTYTGGMTINTGSVMSMNALPGDVTINPAGTLDGYSGASVHPGVPGIGGNLTNAGKIAVHGGDTNVVGNYSQPSTGTLSVSLGSKLAVGGTAALNGGTLEITGADGGYVGNAHTNVLTATGGLTGTFGQLVKDTGVVFTATTINYDANSAWLDTTGLNVTTAAAGNGVSYTPSSFVSAQRVQGAFTQLDSKIAAGNLSSVSSGFVQAAGQFQQAPTLQAAQASLQSLSGQLHAASAAMTFEAIDASSRALADRFDDLLGKNSGFGMWTHDVNVGGDMARAGYDGVGFQLNGWLVGNDRRIGSSGVAGFAFGQSQGRQQLDQSYDRNHSRSTEGMVYAGWRNGDWYTQGRVGFGHFQQDVSRQLLLGTGTQGVSTDYSGNYNVAYGESGLRLNWAGTRVTPFANLEYASIERGGFAEQGAGGFGLRANAQTLDRWQAGLGLRAARHWDLDEGRTIDFNASAQFRRTLASQGDAFNASFVGLQQWQPLVGIGLSRYSGVLSVGLNATLSARTSLKFGYDYEKGQRDQAQMLSTQVVVAL